MLNTLHRWILSTVLVLATLFVLVPVASATTISVTSRTISNWHYTTTTGAGDVQLRIYADRSFITSAGQPVLPGNPQGGAVYKIIPCTVSGPDADGNYTLTIPAFTIDSTTDAQDPPGMSAKYTAFFFTRQGRQLAAYGGFEAFRVLPLYSTDPTTWAAIRADNTANASIPTQTRSYTDQQINQLLRDAIAASSGLTSLNGLSATTQTFVNDTNVTIVSSGSTHTITWAGIGSVPRGMTGAGSFTANGVLYGNGTSALGVTAQGGANSLLVANAGVPSFSQTPTVNTSLAIGVASSQTGSLILRNATNANTVTIAPGVTSASWSWTLPTDDGAANGLLVTDGSGVSSWTNSPTLTALTTTNVTVSSLTSGRVTFAGTAGLLSDDSTFLWDATNDRLSIGTTDSTYAINLANATYLAGRGSVSGAQVRAIGIAAGQQVQSATGSGLSIVDTLVSVDTVNLGPGNTAFQHVYTEAGASALNPFRPLYELGNTGIHVHDGFAGSYNDSVRSGNWHLASIVRNLGTTQTIAVYGEAIGAGSGAQPFAGNFTSVATANNVGLVGVEIGLVALDSGVALTGVGGTGLQIYANKDGAGSYLFDQAIYIGANHAGADFNYGLRFADTNSPVTTALIFGGISNSAVIGIDLSGFNASSDQALKLFNNDGIYSNDASATYAVSLLTMTSTDYLVFGDASASKNIAGTLIYSGAGAESVRIDTSRRMGLNMPASLTYQFGLRPLTTRALTGLVATDSTNAIVTGTGTAFTTELRPGNTLVVNGVSRKVLDIASDTSLTLTSNSLSTLTGQAATSDTDMLEIENAAADHTFLEVDEKGTLVLYDDGALDATTVPATSAPYTDTDGALRIQNRRSANGRFIFGYDHDTSNAYISNRTGTAVSAGWGNIILNAGGTSGFVGIGTAAPIALLTVEGSGVKTADFVSSFFSNTATTATGSITKIAALYSGTGSWVGTNVGSRIELSGGVDANLNRTNYAVVSAGGQALFGPSLSIVSAPSAWLDAYALPVTNITPGGASLTATNPSAAVTGVSTTFTSYRPGMGISFGADATVYEILSITDDTHLTLTAPYTSGATQSPTDSWVDTQLVKVRSGAGAEKFRVLGNETGVVHLEGIGGAPTIAAGTGAGTTPTVSIAGTDIAGTISVRTGAAPATSSTVVTITFNRQWGGTTIPKIILQPTNRATAELTGTNLAYVTQASTTTSSWVITSGTVALGTPVTYTWTYHVIQ